MTTQFDEGLIREHLPKASSLSNLAFRIGTTTHRLGALREKVKELGLSTDHLHTTFRYTDEQLKTLVPESFSYSGLMRKLKKEPAHGMSLRHLKKRVSRLGLDTSHFKLASQVGNKIRRRTIDSILVLQANSEKKTRSALLRRALKEIGRKVICAICGIGSEWCNKSLNLQIDHINGNRFDHRAENLRFLCPNCHSQTPTFGNRKRFSLEAAQELLEIQEQRRRKRLQRQQNLRSLPFCIRCKQQRVRTRDNKYCSRTCANSNVDWNAEILTDLVWEKPFSEIAEELKVTKVAVGRACKRLAIETPPMGYWQRREQLQRRHERRIGEDKSAGA